MKARLRFWSIHSLRIKLAVSLLVMMLPPIGLLLYNNFYAIGVVREQVADSYANALTFYMNQIDTGLNDVDSYMNTVAGPLSSDLLSLDLAVEDDDYYMAKILLYNKLSRDIVLYPTMNSFFVYVDERQDYMEVSKGEITYQEKELVKSNLVEWIRKQDIAPHRGTKRWKQIKIGESQYLMDIVQSGDAYLGAWVKVDHILEPLRSLKLAEEGTILLSSDDGTMMTNPSFVQSYGIELQLQPENYYLSGTDKSFLIVGKNSQRGNFNLYTLIPDESVLANLPYLNKLVWLFSMGAVFFIPIGLYIMRRSILTPLGRVLIAMMRVRGGDWGVRVEPMRGSDEMMLLSNSFNSMMNEIQSLRVNVYEEQLKKQKEELQRLQLQVNPHFFLNSLNIIYNMAKTKNYELIMEMTMALIQFFRFLFRSNTSFVKLKDELEHTRNYLKIQTLRFPEKLAWEIDAAEYLQDMPVPPLIIQSFVENSIKYAVTLEEPVHIIVKIRFTEDESGTMINIRIQDTGQGFRPDVLEELQAGGSVENEQGEHTGIRNVQRRLRLLYGEVISITFDNDKETGGAVINMILPTNPAKEEQA
jgi:two-component system, sensor histidine kinase YesM